MAWAEQFLKIFKKHQAGKGYRTISKAHGLHKSTDRQIIYTLRQLNIIIALSRSDQPTRVTPRARHAVPQEVSKKSKVTSKELKTSLALLNISVQETTIRRIVNNNGAHGKDTRKKPLISQIALLPVYSLQHK